MAEDLKLPFQSEANMDHYIVWFCGRMENCVNGPNNDGSTRRKRGKHKTRSVVRGSAQLPLMPVREADLSLEQPTSSNTLLAMNEQSSPKPSPPGQANILIQCAHGPCQRYMSVHTKGKWCPECSEIEHHSSAWVMVDTDEHGNRFCFKCHANKPLYNMSE